MPQRWKTKLHYVRGGGSLTQKSVSERTGIPLRTYRRLENGELTNPPLRYLVNCALVLNVPLEDVCEDEWLRWTPFDTTARKPTRRLRLTRRD